MLKKLTYKVYFKSEELRSEALKMLKSKKGMGLIEYITIGVLILIIIIGVLAAFKTPLKNIATKIVNMLSNANNDTY